MEDDLYKMHVKLTVEDPRLISGVRIEMNIDTDSGDFTRNYFERQVNEKSQ